MRLADLLAGLSRLADLGFGFPPGESVRSAALAVRFAASLDLSDDDVQTALYTALLHHVGCTGYAHETAHRYGDEFVLNSAATRTNIADPRDLISTMLPTLLRGRSPLDRARLVIAELTSGKRFGQAYTTATCEVGRDTARALGLPGAVQRAVYHLYEFWQGGGAPDGIANDDIPIAARIARLTALAVLYDDLGDADLAVAEIRRRSGGMLDPELTEHFAARAHDLLSEINSGDVRAIVLDAEPSPVTLPEWRLREVATVFGRLADLKTPYTHGHSSGVAALARTAGAELGLPADVLNDLEVAALLHDVGRVAVSDAIWEKPGPLSEGEWEQVRLHAYHSERILAGSERLSALARLAGMHHERLDGSGYHRGCARTELGIPARVLAAADAYHAMTEPRPHRDALAPDRAATELTAEASNGALDSDAVRAVLAAAGQPCAATKPERPAGLSDREVEVLDLLARGHSNARIAEHLVISRRTAEHHVQHIYTKIGVSSRAAAALFAMERGLLRPANR
ncbi:HD domain-containing phosphohydrolase [Haloechinothrix halophila]|uniref:HD domain-containing phosphohydrolase n=1 Tax=Haloechinothrix halophila TaxID=1069073 RepID=UPI00040F7A44|nr:HD domain-containing phosphohydrolase [Haloechinothrix halophila]